MSIDLSKIIMGVVVAISFVTHASEQTNAEILKRIQPVGSVYLAGVAEEVAVVPSGPRSGESVYNTTCVGCHGTGVAGAPKMGDATAWEPRKAQGMDVLFTHALNGFNAMPAKGTCMACTDDELKAAIEHMLNSI